jgi:GNAT superfamily N-acetyltransferase
MATKKAARDPDPNRLIRDSAGAYRSEDGRFEVRDGGTGWFITDGQQTNEFGQELVIGPYATLAAVREALPEARRTTIRPLPRPTSPAEPEEVTTKKAGRKGRSKPKPAPPEHRLVKLLREAARDRFPHADLACEVLPSPPGPSDAVVAFSGHNVIAADVDAGEARAHLPGDDPGGPLSAPFLTWLGLQLGHPPGSVDVVLVADGTGRADPDRPLDELSEDAVPRAFADRVARARRYRTDVRVFADADHHGVAILGRGLAERREVSLEVHPRRRGRGIGAALARAALGVVPEGEPLYAQVAPGNVASLRAFLRAGYRPIGAEVLFLRESDGQ